MTVKDVTKMDTMFRWKTTNRISHLSSSILPSLFNALYVAKHHHNVEFDHSPSNTAVVTLDIYQVQQLILSHSGNLYTHMEIIDALYTLKTPKLVVSPATITFNSEIDGKRIDAIRLDCSKVVSMPCSTTEQTNDIALELSQTKILEPLVSTEQDTKDWKAKASELKEQHEIDRAAIQSLRAIIVDMSETLHEADPNARISMTSADLLELMQGREDTTNNPF